MARGPLMGMTARILNWPDAALAIGPVGGWPEAEDPAPPMAATRSAVSAPMTAMKAGARRRDCAPRARWLCDDTALPPETMVGARGRKPPRRSLTDCRPIVVPCTV